MVLRNAYTEVFEILSYMDKEVVMKIPQDVLLKIKSKRNTEYETKIDKADIFNEENLSKEAVDILCWIEYKYWMSAEERNEINNIIASPKVESEKNSNKHLKLEKVIVNNQISKKEAIEVQKKEVTELVQTLKKESIFMKIISRIKKILIKEENR